MERLHETKELDLKKASKAIWLVKVPKYLSDTWASGTPGSEIGKLKIFASSNASSKKTVFTLNESVVHGNSKLPLDHEFILRKDMGDQHMAVFSVGMIPSDPQDPNSSMIPAGSAAIEGQIRQRCEFKPTMDEDYVNLTRKRVEVSNKPQRELIHLEGPVNNFKPKANHTFNIEYETKKKEEGKKVRLEKGLVMDMLFSAFERHQYYNVKDLVKITNQPITYLKEILREICTYNVKAPFKNTWELKKEFRHYKTGTSKTAGK